jgi:hypothetical protein
MHESAEMRWFLPGPLPPTVLSWFALGGLVYQEARREHRYLLLPGCDTAGIKLRESQLEIKVLRSPRRAIELARGINGLTEQWIKWSLDSEHIQTIKEDVLRSGRWTIIRKQRYLRKLSWESGTPVEVPAVEKPFPLHGCLIELSEITTDWPPTAKFSLGFEAFGPGADIEKILRNTARGFFQSRGRIPGVRLTKRTSFSYPGLLRMLQLNIRSGDFSNS